MTRSIDQYYRYLGKSKPLTRSQEQVASSNELFSQNLKLVVSIAKKFLGRGLELEDLIQEGNLGLMTASKKFSPSKECKFSTYATFWIRQAILAAISEKGRTIRIPSYATEFYNKIRNTKSHLELSLGREPSYEEIAKVLEEKVSKVSFTAEIITSSSHMISMDSLFEEGDGHEVIEDTSGVSALDVLLSKDRTTNLSEVLNSLTEKEKEVITLRFGFGENDEHSLKAIGDKLGLSLERIRQIESIVLKKMKVLLDKNRA